MRKVVYKYNELFETNVNYLSDKQVLLLVEKMELKDIFPFEKFEYGKSLQNQPREIISFWDRVITGVEIDAKEVIPGLVSKIYKFGVKKKKFTWRDLTIQNIYTAIVSTGKEEQTEWLFEAWDMSSEFISKQSEEVAKLVLEHLEKLDIGDDDDSTDGNSDNQSDLGSQAGE